ncbi:sensor histidine kinase [Noviherbaspirillum sp. ST9]|uniref:sensor histidine kinase n=1 Tax=Noviherbaspirillum sp. ST9 TaxID=3401606 RepID=UPI003B5894AA
MNRRRYSMRRRLAGWTLACLVLILGGMGIAAYLAAKHESDEIFSARLATSARVLEALVARQLGIATTPSPIIITLPPELEHARGGKAQASGHPYENKIAFQVRDEQGVLLARSASAPDRAVSPLRAGFGKYSLGEEVWQVFVLKSGRVWILAAEKDEVRQEMIRELGMSILMPLLIGAVLLVAAVNIVLLYNMRPLKSLAARIASREPGSLAPIELPTMPKELVPIVDELNALLTRVNAAFEREQRFIDAAAHEIRTPLAALQLHVQNALKADSIQEREGCLAEAVVALRRTTNLAEQLLSFSRITSETSATAHENLSLDDMCREVVAMQEPLLEERGQSIGLSVQGHCSVLGDRAKSQRLLQNLIDNASRHGSPEGEIDVAVYASDGHVVLEVANNGAPIPQSEVENIFAPYYRLPGKSGFGAGLGLAIVREIADQHGAHVSVSTLPDGQGTVVSVWFPHVEQT